MDNLHEQFSQIYDQYIEKIYRFVYLKVNSRDIAEDITSKVFVKGWEAYQKSQNPDSKIQNTGAFLYQIARNAVVDYYREKGRISTVSSEVLPEISDPADSIYDKAVLDADVSLIKAGIKNLKPEHQDIIIWHYLEDIPIAQIAKMLDKPAGTVRVMLHRGLKELKKFVTLG